MRFIRRKVIQLIVVILAVTFLTFLMLNLLPGDTAVVICGAGCDEAALEQVREDLGLNEPLLVRYVNWLTDALTGDLGASAINRQPVWEALQQRMPGSPTAPSTASRAASRSRCSRCRSSSPASC